MNDRKRDVSYTYMKSRTPLTFQSSFSLPRPLHVLRTAMTSNAVVQTLPSEIWRRITELACVDGGRTGVSLAMSCKYLRAQTFAGRFYTLTLHSLVQLESFLICVDSLKETSDLRILRVRHLWLSFLHETAIPKTSVEEPNASKSEWEARVLTTLRPLLPLIAPTLLTLVVAQRVSWPLPPSALALSFPQLTELTFLNGPTDGPPTGDRASTAHWPFDLARRPFPALRRLHVIGDHPHARRALLATPAHAPTLCQLTHLRFSGIYHGDYLRSFVKQPLAPVLAQALGVSTATLAQGPTSSSPPGADDPATSTPRADAAPSRPPLARLRHLILHGIEPASGRSSVPRSE